MREKKERSIAMDLIKVVTENENDWQGEIEKVTRLGKYAEEKKLTNKD